MKNKFEIVENAKRQARMIFLGMAIPCQKKLADGEYGPIRCEKVLKFNRKALRRGSVTKVEKSDPRFVGGVDNMRFAVGKPGSVERVQALIAQYASLSDDEMSPFIEG